MAVGRGHGSVEPNDVSVLNATQASPAEGGGRAEG